MSSARSLRVVRRNVGFIPRGESTTTPSLLAYIADTECGIKESNHARDWSCSARAWNRYGPADAVGCCRQSLVCHLFQAGWRQRELRLCDARAVPGTSVGTRRLVPPESVSRHGVWDRRHLVIRAATTEAGRVVTAEVVAVPRRRSHWAIPESFRSLPCSRRRPMPRPCLSSDARARHRPQPLNSMM